MLVCIGHMSAGALCARGAQVLCFLLPPSAAHRFRGPWPLFYCAPFGQEGSPYTDQTPDPYIETLAREGCAVEKRPGASAYVTIL